METVPEEPEEIPSANVKKDHLLQEEEGPTEVQAGTDPPEQEDEGPAKVNTGTDPPEQEYEGPAKVDTGTDPPEQEEEGSYQGNQTDMEEPASRPTDLSKRGSRNLAQMDGEEVDTSKMKYVEGVQCAIVDVMDTGFTMPEVIVMEGQGVLFEKGGRKTLEIVQVIHDGDSLRPVIGGFSSKESKVKDKEDNYIQQFNLEGEYKFAVSKIRCTPLTVIVRRRLPLRAEVTDEGFNPKIIAIEQGDTVEWSWKDCSVPHSVQEVNYLFDKGVFVKGQWSDGASNVVRTITGDFSKKFPRPGVYYFQTESAELHKQHFCVVRVRQSIREYKVEISDRAFHPPVLLIETGDRVWWYWDKYKCKKHHCVYQIEAPTLDQDDEEPYQPVQNGFRWSQPSKQGLLSHVFMEPGVFYYSDQNFQEAAEYIGTVIVKPKPKEHRVMIQEKGFDPEVIRIRTGERIWFWWNPILFSKKNIQVLLKEVEKCLNPATKRPSTPEDESKYQHPDEETVKLMTDVGFSSVFYSTTGVYQYRVRNSTVCSVIVSPGEKNHTIHLTDSGPEQKVIMSVRPNDRVWWVWQSTKKQHNVMQVSHQGDPFPGGFCSGMARDSPSAFVHTFKFPGVFYYKSQSLPKIFGAVVVTTQPVVHEVEVGPIIRPDPISVKVHDIVCWIFNTSQKENVMEIDHPDQVVENLQCEEVSPRCCLSKAIDRTGVIHFYSKSFNKQKKNIENYLGDVRFSSVISDERYDNTVIKLDKHGFHPHFVYVQKGESVRWTWISTDEEHNIIHVTSPDSKEPLNVVGGVKSFNSGKSVKNNSFLHTFDELGNFTVASQGAPGYSCTVNVISSAEHVKEPAIAANFLNGGTIDQFSKIELTCETLGSKIFYTTDGSPPELHMESAKLYSPEKGVILKKHGLCFVRAMAVKEGLLNSSIFTSNRYWVLAKDGTVDESSSETESSEQKRETSQTPQKNDNWDWWSCAPTIKACFTDPGVMEVFWEEPNAVQKKLIRGYQIFLNGVAYCDMFPANNNSLNLTGLAGNRMYEVYVEVYSLDRKLNPQSSNKLTLKVPLMTKEGGPVISLERTNKQDALVVVWMSIDTTEYPIKGYLVFLNDQQCGAMLVPDPDKNRCKVFIGGCELNKEHRIYVVALPKDNVEDGRMSNVIEVVLPLDTSQIVLPDDDERLDQEELYHEYISIQEGSGYLTAMDVKRRHIEINNIPPLTTTYQYSSKQTDNDKRSGVPPVVEVEDPRHRDQSVMTDDNYEKGTQTPRGKSRVKTLGDSYGSGDFSVNRAQSRRAHRSDSESDTESETGSSETGSETESETDSEGTRLSNDGSVMVVSMKDAKYAPKVTREEIQQSRPRSSYMTRGEKSDSATQSDIAPRPPSARRYRDINSPRSDFSPRSVRRAIIEVEETASVDLNEDKMMKSVVVSQDKGHRRRRVEEGEPVYNPANDAQVGVPAPTIKVSSMGKSGLIVEWYIDNHVESDYEVQQYIVNIVGRDFSARDINSHISFECNLVDIKGHGVRGTQHCWTMDGNKRKINIRGLYPDNTYRVFVVANYGFRDDEDEQKPIEVQATSPVIYYTTIGPPLPPFVRVLSVGLYQATVQWDPPRLQSGLELLGFKIYVDNKVLRGLQRKDTRQMVINDLVPGKTIGVAVVAVLKQSGIESEPSRQVHITCPKKPPPPHVSQQPLHKHGSVLVAWDKPAGVRRAVAQEGITSYRIYVNDKYFGKIDASPKMDRQGYQYVITGLNPEESYDVKVKSMSGQKQVDPDQNHIFCLSESSFSNIIPVQAPAAPKSPELRLESMTPQGIRVTWLAPQQYGEAEISGYRLLKNGKLYGHIMGPDVNAVDITGISLGDRVVLQLVALTNHPVGKLERALLELERDESSPRQQAQLTGSDQKVFTLTEGVKTKGWTKTESTNKLEDLLLGEKYAGCRPGPKLTVHYTGLVKAPDEVWLEQVTGHSALVVWKKEDNVHGHFVRPDHYVVTWWCGDKSDVQSEESREDHILITGLHPATTYTIVVEARRMENYRVEGEENDTTNKFILTAQSETLTLRTARPPNPPSNLSIAASTCNSLRLVWDPPVEHGVEIIAIRIDAQSINTSDPHHVAVEVRPDECKADIENLREKTDYVLRVTAVTDEYFDRLPEKHKLKKVRAIPRDRMVAADDSIWLPNTYTMAKTAGTEPPANLKIIQSSTSGLSVSWVLPIVYGSNKLVGQVLRWSDVKNSKKGDSEWYVASHINLDPGDNNVTIEDLTPGAQYKIVVEAVVSIKTSLESAENDKNIQRYRRTANVMSKPLFTRTRAPTEPPRVYITGYSQTTAQLYWEKPPLVSVIGKENDGRPKYLRRYLEGYKLEINDRLHSCLGPNAQSCQLTKCKPGKKYQVVLVALTCTDQGKKDRKKKYKGVYRNVSLQTVDYSALLQDEDNLDPSPSEPLEIVLPKDQDGYIKGIECTFKHDEDRDNSTFGDVELRWETQGERSDVISHIKQFNVIWSNNEERQVQTKVITPDARKTLIPVTRLKASYDIQVEPDYFTDALHQVNQRIQLVIPGPPDPPEIFLKSVSPEEFVIEWGEPRLFGGVKVRGYQVYLNDKKVGNELSNSHRKAVIPCRPNKNYKVQLVALSDNSFYSDSSFSNSLLVSTSPHSPRLLSGEDMVREDQDMIPVKVIAVTETSIQLDWTNFLETEGVAGYKIQWSSVAQPAQREVKLSEKDSSCVINNCLPGTTHFVRLTAIDNDGQILEKSKQLTVQTSAPPDAPNLSVRACNFRYIAVQWEKPNTYGDALVTGYKVYVNGIVEAILNAEQMSFTFTHGKWCQEYAFQVQALTSFDKLHSKVSEPLVVVWPGCKAPALKRLPTHSSSCIRIAWEDPYLTEGVKVKHFRAVCVERDTEKEVTPSIGPIHPNTREGEFKNLKRGSYSIFLEVHLYNTGDVVCSEPLHVAPAPAPDPPLVTVTVVGLDERRALERLTCDLVNKRDRLIRKVGHKLKEIGALSNPLRAEKNRGVIEGAHTLSRIEEILEHCFSALEHYTGQLIAHVSWSCPQRRSETQVSGFKVLIDGKQYGNTMHEGVKQVRIKLGTEEPIYKLTMVSVSNKPQASSEESNAVDLLSETFRPFSFYCYHSIHNQNARWPNQGCCKYQDSVMYERQLAKKLANQGLLKRKVPPPACSLLDIFQGEYKPFLETHNKQFPTAILFWTPWCQGSQKVMSHFARFARETSSEYNFIAVSCGVTANHASDRKSLIHSITSNGWREQGTIWHCTSQCASAIDEASSVWKNSTAGSSSRNEMENGKKHVDLTEILGIAGVPTFLFIHAEGYIAWHGRYSAYDYASYAAFMRHTFSEVQGVGCPAFQCDSCRNDMTIDDEALEPVLQLVRESSTSALSALKYPEERRPSSPKRAESPTNTDPPIDRIFMKKRPRSPKRHKKISVNQRPFSASNVNQSPSHYVQLLKSPYMQKTVPSPKVLNKLLRPQSGGARLG
ncbi:uncharacterized protein LOC125654190 isoform X5 [Ostrea edulis]|uniref:uncharacterized protein LOC125654190 isoform X5 n=1 Tax=Ostrea edulis TaxID=37623 RepID=UPI0024AF54EE|nr:uncharacterized protein LOC125654190 isoform X5 [Ostrea edulis]